MHEEKIYNIKIERHSSRTPSESTKYSAYAEYKKGTIGDGTYYFKEIDDDIVTLTNIQNIDESTDLSLSSSELSIIASRLVGRYDIRKVTAAGYTIAEMEVSRYDDKKFVEIKDSVNNNKTDDE